MTHLRGRLQLILVTCESRARIILLNRTRARKQKLTARHLSPCPAAVCLPKAGSGQHNLIKSFS